jgi:hypothetical protein
MRILSALAFLALAACGAEGDPQKPGVVVSGEASAGVVVR